MINPQDVDIRKLLPQQPPMVMVDRLLFADLRSAVTSFEIRSDNLFVENGVLKSYALIENFAQTCAAQLGFVDKYIRGHDYVRIGYIGSVKKMQVYEVPRVGETLTTRMEISDEVMDFMLIYAESFVGDRRAATVEMKIALSGEKITV